MTSVARAMAAESAGNWQAAEAWYLKALEAEPRDAAVLHRLGVVLHRLGRPWEAVARFQASLAIAKDAAGKLEVYLDFGAALGAVTRWDAAEAVYAAALRLAPSSIDAHYGLAIARHSQGRPREAEPHYRTVLAANPGLGAVHGNLGVALEDQGRFVEAADAHREAARLAPADPAAWRRLGVALHHLKRIGEAKAAYRTAIGLAPDDADAWRSLACLLDAGGPAAEACADGRRAVALDPADGRNWQALGNAAHALERWDVALRAASAAVRIDPSDPGARNNLASALWASGRPREAVDQYRSALGLRPDFPVVEINLAQSLSGLRDTDGALAVLRGLLARDPENAGAWRAAGGVLMDAARPDAAVAAFRRAIAAAPGDAETYVDLAGAAVLAAWSDQAVAACRRALRLAPGHAAALGHLVQQQKLACDWTDLESREALLVQRVRDGAAGVPPFILLSCPSTPADQRSAAARWAASKALGATPVARPAPPAGAGDGAGDGDGDRRLRIGYLSSDFREHALGHLMVDALESHDRSGFAVTAYSTGMDDGSPLRRRFERGMERFVDLRRHADGDAARAIAADDIDILVDLTGFTSFSRTTILAARPAPVQVNWLGYPGTFGAGWVDYIIADPTVIPAGEDEFFTEAVVRLPDCYQPNDRHRAIADTTPTRESCGLPADGFVFCCFNSPYKLMPAVFDVWARLLRAVPGSVLWLYAGNAAVAGNLRREAEARGIAPDRLVFAPPRPHAEHLARHRLADLFLDTLPYNAHTTASDALWAGLPVLTRRGPTFAGRVAASLLQAAGLPELVTDGPEAYEALAVALARDPARLRALRARLARNRPTCALFDTPRFTRHLEAAYRAMWDIHRAGDPPRPITITRTDP
ncbi:O-linked N-acetylglucosamine transferase family protein [Azospirillum rugosum]|uniref:protein O-GlcNAc transferase n=1 Tax=Azospirillum rugosum TaxID=416170 RepID=A0ABS4SR77_9PROT|nr:tetratricopeptide repeat protein [Azospirillum rugosum]MBP2295064.1 putative O-linked N-acetylglucosamine transferase (SPINDLY family) [Azospirillum rugosum]MDQ0528887.1 putative O-linked N-acetylglucosamine transferase (SPINDLY family) [Azospirillum rugosum]